MDFKKAVIIDRSNYILNAWALIEKLRNPQAQIILRNFRISENMIEKKEILIWLNIRVCIFDDINLL